MRTSWITCVLLAVTLAGCASAAGERNDPFAGMDGGGERLTIAVLNNNASEVRIRVIVEQGREQALGSLIPQEIEVFEIPWTGLQQLRLVVDQVAGDRYVTPYVSVRAGARVDVVVQRNIRNTRIRVR